MRTSGKQKKKKSETRELIILTPSSLGCVRQREETEKRYNSVNKEHRYHSFVSAEMNTVG